LSFNSLLFVPFISLVLILYYFLSQKKQNRLLLIASYVFYGALDYRFLILIFISTAVDYLVALRINQADRAVKKRVYLGISLVINLGILFCFKYLGFFVTSVVEVAKAVGLSLPEPALHIILPAALSFYTFKTLSYSIDVYRGQLSPSRNFFDYALYVSFFPQLLAGPIERAGHFLPQLQTKRAITRDKIIQGAWLILWGFFKKAVVADNLGQMVQNVFDNGNAATGFHILLAVYAFSIQIYCDFSGYSDIARGIGKLLGFESLLNFDRPYLAANPVEFWKRWHISLSTWLRDYLFLPIAYASMRHIKKPALKLKVEDWGYIIGIVATMLLGGLWHGAAWTFVLWGGYHGILIALQHLLTRRGKKKRTKSQAVRMVKIFSFFNLTALGWLIFRAKSLGQAWDFLRRILFDFSVSSDDLTMMFLPCFFCLILFVLELWVRNSDDPRKSPGWRYGLGPAAVTILILLLIFFSAPTGQDFIYSQF
jgi:alginate O-acetyltransferase complex protein AlgI